MAKYKLTLQLSNGNSIDAGQFTCVDLTQVEVNLLVAGWSNKTQTYTNARITGDSAIISSPTAGSWEKAASAGVKCVSQSDDGKVVFNCDEVPETDLSFVLMIFNQ